MPDLSSPLMPHPESPERQAQRAKLRLLFPIALIVAVLSLFLAAFWPSSRATAKTHRSHAEALNAPPIGPAEKHGGGPQGNLRVTPGIGTTGSPVGGQDTRAPREPKAGGWWYADKEMEKGAQGKDDRWWYREK